MFLWVKVQKNGCYLISGTSFIFFEIFRSILLTTRATSITYSRITYLMNVILQFVSLIRTYNFYSSVRSFINYNASVISKFLITVTFKWLNCRENENSLLIDNLYNKDKLIYL